MDADGDAAFELFFGAQYPSVVRAAHLIVGDEDLAREVAQEAFARLYLRWGRVSGYDKPGAWVRGVAVRESIRVARKREPTSPLSVAGARTADDRHDVIDVHAALRRLPLRERSAVVAHYLWDLPVAEVAALMGTSPGTVKAQLHSGRRRLAALLEESEP